MACLKVALTCLAFNYCIGYCETNPSSANFGVFLSFVFRLFFCRYFRVWVIKDLIAFRSDTKKAYESLEVSG